MRRIAMPATSQSTPTPTARQNNRIGVETSDLNEVHDVVQIGGSARRRRTHMPQIARGRHSTGVAVDGRRSSVYDRRKPRKASAMARIPGASGGYWLRALKAFVVLGGILIAAGLAHWLYHLVTR
jgi:hypothetical protein